VSSKGQIVLPAEFRLRDRLEAGQEFEVERLDRGESGGSSGAQRGPMKVASIGCAPAPKRIQERFAEGG
jgi:bifunctional DNA-binding transcriptional regulator/antitoxin component of YhaV-PrlF toxin-antitoxin module